MWLQEERRRVPHHKPEETLACERVIVAATQAGMSELWRRRLFSTDVFAFQEYF